MLSISGVSCGVGLHGFIATFLSLPLVTLQQVTQTSGAPADRPAGAVLSSVDFQPVPGLSRRGAPPSKGAPQPFAPDHAARGPRVVGDTCDAPFVIDVLPFSDTGDTCGFVNDYDEVCPYSGSLAPDVVYEYTPVADEAIAIVLCEGATAYDTKVYVYEDLCPDPGLPIACNDDACESLGYPHDYVSQLGGVALWVGHTYYIVLDGFGDGEDSCGFYELEVFNVPSPVCPADTVFGQNVHPPLPEWEAATSASSFTVYDEFSGVDTAICELSWWGLSLICCWAECDPSAMMFEVAFYEDAAGLPGREVCSYVTTPEITGTHALYLGMELYHFTIPTLDPCCYLGAGWISIRSHPHPDGCLFLWMSSPDGDGISWQFTDGLMSLVFDRAFCLVGEGPPVLGACCDENSGVCVEGVPMSECLVPSRFVPHGTCSDLVPPCGDATGACCLTDGICTITTADQCAELWLGADSSCDLCPCVIPCTPNEGEPLCHDEYEDEYNGGCNSAPPTFQPIACGETICGESGTFFSDGMNFRDTDWFELITTTGGAFKFDVEAEFPVQAIILDGNSGCDALEVLGDHNAGACYTASVTTPCLPPGQYWFWIGPDDPALAIPCGARYMATLTCLGSIPDFEVMAPGGWSGDTCNAGNDSTLQPSSDHSYLLTIPNDGEWILDVCDADWNTVLYIGTSCSLGDIAVNDDACGEQSRIELYLPAGEYWVTLEGVSSNDCGPYTLNATYIEPCELDCASGSEPEGEPTCTDEYVDTYNGGCAADLPMFQPVSCGQTICGESGVFEGGAGVADQVYMHEYGSGDLTLFDTNIGAEIPIGDTGIGGFLPLAAAPVPVPQAGGGYWPAGTVFGLERGTGTLYVIDTTDASLTTVGTDVANLIGSQGLAFGLDGVLYALRDSGDEYGQFVAVSTETGAGNLIGACDVYDLDGLTVFPVAKSIQGFGTAQAGDFLACDGTDLFHIDPATLTATFIGDDAPAHQTLDFSSNGTLYGQDWDGGLYTITLNPLSNAFVGHVSQQVDGMCVLRTVVPDRFRDEDWYELVTTQPGVYTWTVEAEFDVVIEMIDAGSGDCTDHAVRTSGGAEDCTPASFTTDCLPAGQYWLRLRPQAVVGTPCGALYNATLGCEPCSVTYCSASGGCGVHISRVTFGDLDNASNAADCDATDGYSFHAMPCQELTRGTQYAISVENGNPAGMGDDKCGVWIDWDADGVFDPSTESIVLGGTPGPGPYTGTIDVPTDAALGESRLRIRLKAEGGLMWPCGPTQQGEVEDYCITIVDPSVPGDLDGDQDVDSDDFVIFVVCLAGPNVLTPPPGCDPDDFTAADLSGDGDVDVQDFALFQQAFNGGG